jgi:hypothetical protein
MPSASSLRRLTRLRLPEALLLGEALVVLAGASAAIRVLPFSRVTHLASTRGRPSPPGAVEPESPEAARVVRAVQAWSRRVPWKTVCFQIGLAAHLMLRRRGLATILHYGVGRGGEEEDLAAHVWVTLGEKVLVGEFESAQFARVASFPPDDAPRSPPAPVNL